MDTEAYGGSEVIVGCCNNCNDRRVLIRYKTEAYCSTCIRKDEHLKSMIGWR